MQIKTWLQRLSWAHELVVGLAQGRSTLLNGYLDFAKNPMVFERLQVFFAVFERPPAGAEWQGCEGPSAPFHVVLLHLYLHLSGLCAEIVLQPCGPQGVAKDSGSAVADELVVGHVPGGAI